ncbi:recombinase RecT [Sporanaerobacter acetigenes]|uniref:recombinase RecT n=1 Tax=Sporanaerobacter acetigenes TaxID=165813 RepID=UPI00331D674F
MTNKIANKNNSITQNHTVKSLLNVEGYQKRFREVLGSRAPQFMSSIISAVNSNAALGECEPNTVIQSALKAAILDLPIEDNFGFAYLVPYYNSKKGYKECQFQLGYKGYIQLALRTGMYRNINVIDIREGELKSWNPLTEELEVEFIEDEKEREGKGVLGYAGYFSLLNGFEKKVYWTVDSLLNHATKYSAQYRKYKSGMWSDNLDDMCKKTVIKNMINKWGILSVEMQTPNQQLLEAIKADQAVIRNEDEYDYVDNDPGEMIEAEVEIEDSTKVNDDFIVDNPDLPWNNSDGEDNKSF